MQSKLPEAAPENRPAVDPEEAILCRSCRTLVTESREAVSEKGSHLHTFFNPAGIVFEIRCFRRAGGCTVYGEPTAEFAWFAGSQWQYAICATCQVHLGWFFTTQANSFFGLIRDRLIMPEDRMHRRQAMLLLRVVGDRIVFYLRESNNGSPSW